MEDDLVSVIIPAYNMEQYIGTCIDSVLNQTYRCLEVILVDDGSVDATLERCRQYADKRIQIITQSNQGVAEARNTGVNQAHGEWVLFVDADDWIEPYLLDELMKHASDRKDLVLYHSYKMVGKKRQKLYAFPPDAPSSGTAAFRTFFSSQYSWGVLWGKLFRRSLITGNNIQFDKNLLVGEDRDFMSRFAGCCRNVGYCNIFGYYYRMNGGSVSRRYLEGKTQAYLYLCKKMSERFRDARDISFLRDFQGWLVGIATKIVINGIFHPDNPVSYHDKKKELGMLLQDGVFRNAIENVNVRAYGWGKGIFIFALKHRWYLAVNIISHIRVHQVQRGNGE